MHPFGSGDFNEAMQRQLQQTADIARQQTVLAKRFAALELTRIEGEITVAQARVKVSEATIRQLQLTQQTCSEADTARLNALIGAAEAQRDAHQEEVKSLTLLLDIKNEMAKATLNVDANAMHSMLANLIHRDPDQPTG